MISGYICIRNGTILDYCWELAAKSLIPVCEEVILCVGTSEDDTRERVEEFVKIDSRLRMVDYQWPRPIGDPKWWTDYLNAARAHCCHPMQLTLDADEVLCPGSYAEVRRAAENRECRWFHRLNFWRDPQHIAPHGRVCGEQVVRLAPTELWMCSDEMHPEGEPEIRLRAGWPPCATPAMRVFHYGFLRKEECFIEKVRTLNRSFFAAPVDARVAHAAEKGTPWVNEIEFDRPMLQYTGTHPELAHQWLRSRGHSI